MKATNEARCVFYQREWSVEEIKAGDHNDDNEALREECNLTLLEIAQKIRGWKISDSSEIDEYTFAHRREYNFKSGGSIVSSLHLTFGATEQEERIWVKALEYAKRKGWV